ncbi:MAG: ZrgA family zinc uptake protein [Bacillota bacterium]
MFKVLLFSMMAMAAREHGAHVHGNAKISMGFDDKSGKIEFHAPANAIYGFEYVAKSAKDKANKDQSLKKLSDKISEMIEFDPALKCEVSMEMYEVDQKDSHADVDVEYKVKCEKSPAGSLVTFNVQKVFPHIKTVKVDVLLGDVQKSQEIKKSGDTLELK